MVLTGEGRAGTLMGEEEGKKKGRDRARSSSSVLKAQKGILVFQKNLGQNSLRGGFFWPVVLK